MNFFCWSTKLQINQHVATSKCPRDAVRRWWAIEMMNFTIYGNEIVFILIFTDDFYDPVGSFDDTECISPTDAQQWLYDRARGQNSLDTFLSNNEDIKEEDDDEMAEFDTQNKHRRDSESLQFPANLSDESKARVMSCMDEIRNITGETYSDKKLYDAIMANDYDINRALDEILNNETPAAQTSKKPRIPEVQKGW